MTLPLILSILGFALALGGLVQRLRTPEGRRDGIAVALTALLFLTAYAVTEAYRHERLVRRLSTDILVALGHEAKAFDEVFEALHYPELTAVTEALNRLVDTGAVGHAVFELRDDKSFHYRVRTYYAKTPRS